MVFSGLKQFFISFSPVPLESFAPTIEAGLLQVSIVILNRTVSLNSTAKILSLCDEFCFSAQFDLYVKSFSHNGQSLFPELVEPANFSGRE
jgi:hypothetical protein